MGDHGYGLGEHAAWGKSTMFDFALQAPVILSVPWLPNSFGRTSASVGELLDIGPTLASLVQIGVPDEWVGVDQSRLLTEPDYAVKSYAYSQFPGCSMSTFEEARKGCKLNSGFSMMGYSVRSRDWRYTRWLWTGNGTLNVDWSSRK